MTNPPETPAPSPQSEPHSHKTAHKKPKEPSQTKRPGLPPGPRLNVTAFVDLMRKVETASASLTNDQVRFVQLCIQRFEHDQQGIVKMKFAMPKPKREKARRRAPTTSLAPLPRQDAASDAFLDRLTHAATEDEVILAVQDLSDARAEQLAASQGLRNTSPEQARQKLLETIITLRQMSRIQNAGKKDFKVI
jgi:hypothetical protein